MSAIEIYLIGKEIPSAMANSFQTETQQIINHIFDDANKDEISIIQTPAGQKRYPEEELADQVPILHFRAEINDERIFLGDLISSVFKTNTGTTLYHKNENNTEFDIPEIELLVSNMLQMNVEEAMPERPAIENIDHSSKMATNKQIYTGLLIAGVAIMLAKYNQS